MQYYVLWRVYYVCFPSGGIYCSTKPLEGVVFFPLEGYAWVMHYDILWRVYYKYFTSGGICCARKHLEGVGSFFLYKIMQ